MHQAFKMYIPSCIAPVPIPYVESKNFMNYKARFLNPSHKAIAPLFGRINILNESLNMIK